MDHFQDASAETALAVLTDTAKIHGIEEAVETEDEQTVEETVRAAYSAKAREMEEAVVASQQRAAKAEQARNEASASIVELEAEHARQREAAAYAECERQAEWEP